jgi:PAS domain S-box-containing protein
VLASAEVARAVGRGVPVQKSRGEVVVPLGVPDPVPASVLPLFDALSRSPDAVFITDRRNRIVSWNNSAERLLGFTAEEALGMPCASTLEGCDSHGNRYCSDSCPITQLALRNETVRNFELRLQAKGGHVVVADVSVLHFAVPAPDLFFLAHIVHPSARHHPQQHALEQEGAAPPRPTLVTVRGSEDARARKLTGREVEVLGLLAAGNPTAEIGARLHISTLTARNHIQNILDKLEVHSKTEAVAFAFQKHLI